MLEWMIALGGGMCTGLKSMPSGRLYIYIYIYISVYITRGIGIAWF